MSSTPKIPLGVAAWRAVQRRQLMRDAVDLSRNPNMPQKQREMYVWWALLRWASLGGTPDEVIR